MKRIIAIASLLTLSAVTFGQTKFTEGSIVYSISVNTADTTAKLADGFDGATNSVFIKGNISRTELVSVYGTQSTIIDGKTGNVVVLKEYGDKRYLINMTHKNWLDVNRKFDSTSFVFEEQYKEVAGYHCQKATGRLKSGETFIVYFTKDLVFENRDVQYSNRSLPGIALQYESNLGKNKVVFTASKLSFDPVPASKFDIPKTGFRVMSYEESLGGR